MDKTDKNGAIELPEIKKVMVKYSPGDKVVIKDKRFEGITATCLKSSTERIIVLMDLLSGCPKLSFSVDDVSKLAAQ